MIFNAQNVCALTVTILFVSLQQTANGKYEPNVQNRENYFYFGRGQSSHSRIANSFFVIRSYYF